MRYTVLILLLLSIVNTGEAMAMFEGKTIFLFSKVEGKLTKKNQPVGNVVIHRLVEHNGKKYEDSVKTDENGFFNFEPLTEKDRSILPKEFVAHQKLIAIYDEKEYLIWETVKRSEEENSELEGKNLILECELTNKQRFVHLTLNSIGTICNW